ncbi:uncharacterized protein LOC133341488 isoform X2 [Lethenteron reissneri]|uniref:uncharacterized protein LOC133341488 isoform X2 n=1 Tax=Lethenteron reissneri TaxID=7753 RepID=UPI002AB69D2A|nr:uncharacterized protein LOC133341488 isoform X2 [Lethenteron reissneri]
MEHKPDIRCNMDDEETAIMRGMWIPLGLPYIGKNGAPRPSMCELIFRKMVSLGTQTEFADEAQAKPRTWANAVSQTMDIAWASPIGLPKGTLREGPFDLDEDITRASLCYRGREEMDTPQGCNVALKKGIAEASPIGMEGSIARTHPDGMDNEQGYIENVILDNLSQEEGFVALLNEFGDISEGIELLDQQQNCTRQCPPVKRGFLLEAEPETGLDKEQMTPADDSSHQAGNIILKMWRISSAGGTAVFVEGIRTDSNVMWHSSGIVQRLSARQLKTKSGAIYSLKGPPNFHNRESSVFPSAVYRKFMNGFPDDWDKVLTQHLAIHKTEARAAQPSKRGEPPANDKARQPKTASLTKRRLPAAPCTRSGRHVRPPLDYWRGEHLITDPKTGKVHVTAGGHDYLLSHTIITPTCKYLSEMAKPAEDMTDTSLTRPKPRSIKAPARQVSDHDGTTKGSHKHQPIVPKPTARRLTEVKLALDALLQDLSSANQTESHTEQTESHTEQTESHTEQTERHTEQTESHTEQTESHTEQTESHTEQTESHTEQTESHTEQMESHTEQTERGSLGGAGPTSGEVARMDHNRLKLVPYISLKRIILPDTLGAIQNLPSPPDAQTLESPHPRENQVALQHSSRKRTLTFQDPTELLTELQECTEAIDEEESASESIVRKAKRPRRTTSGPTVSTAATPTKEVGAQSEQQRVESKRHSPSRPALEKPCQKPRNHEATGNERDLGWPQSSSSSSDECLSRNKRLRTRSEREALHLSAKRSALEAVTKAARFQNLQFSESTKTVGVKPGMVSAYGTGSIGGNRAACAWRPLQLPLNSTDLPLNTATDFIFSAITESEYNRHLRYAEGDHDLSD